MSAGKRPRLPSERSQRDLAIRCPVCHRRAIAVVLDVRFGPFGGSWVSLPDGWFSVAGSRIDGLTRGLVRCPDCAPWPDDATLEPMPEPPACPKCQSPDTRWIPYGHDSALGGGHDVMSGDEPGVACRACGHTFGEVTDINFKVPYGS